MDEREKWKDNKSEMKQRENEGLSEIKAKEKIKRKRYGEYKIKRECIKFNGKFGNEKRE
jgi:hypothetical protein